MKKILCFGDSNTWGYKPHLGTRYSETERWPTRLKTLLGEEWLLTENGQPGRTLCYEARSSGFVSGFDELTEALASQEWACIIVMLGTNDLCSAFMPDVTEITAKLEQALLGMDNQAAKIVVSPSAIITGGSFSQFFHGNELLISDLADHYQRICNKYGWNFINGADLLTPDPTEGIHLTPESHKALALSLYQIMSC